MQTSEKKVNSADDLSIQYLDWDSEQLDIHCGLIDLSGDCAGKDPRILFDELNALLAENEDVKFITIKMDFSLKGILSPVIGLGARLIDTELTFRFSRSQVRNVTPLSSAYRLEFCRKVESKYFESLSGQMIKSRFFQDPHIPYVQAEALWKESIRNHCEGFADELLVCYYDDIPCGLVNISFKDDKKLYLHIVGVLKEYQRRGVSQIMLGKIVEKYSGDFRIYVETQSDNQAAQKAYQKSGFVYDSLKYILHLWC